MLETARLIVRRIEASDAAAMHAVYGDAEAMRWVGDGRPIEYSECERWIGVTQRNYVTRGYGMFAVLERQSADVIGFVGLVHPGGQVETEIKYALLRGFWGRGLATEVVTALLGHGASAFGLSHVIATTFPENTASHRVLLKAGMQPCGLRPNEDGTSTQLFAWQPAHRDTVL